VDECKPLPHTGSATTFPSHSNPEGLFHLELCINGRKEKCLKVVVKIEA